MSNKMNSKDTTISRNGASKWISGPFWLRQRTLGKNKPQRLQASHDLIRRLGEEACLESRGDYKCCVEFNEKGDLLACISYNRESGDRDIVVWEVFKRQEKCLFGLGDNHNVNSLKFLPAPHDNQIVTRSFHCKLRLTDVLCNKTSIVCESHGSYSKQLAVHSSEPNLVWFSSTDGFISQHDVRQAHECKDYYLGNRPSCMAINPLRGAMLAVGFMDGYTCLLDRRMLKSDSSQSCLAVFPPVYLHKPKHQKHGTTYLAFNSDGSELLASVYQDQIYLYNTYKPWEKYQSFDLSVKPLLSDRPQLINPRTSSSLRPYSHLKDLQKRCPIKLQSDLKVFCDNILSRYSGFRGRNNTIDRINELLDEQLFRELDSNYQPASLQDKHIIEYLNVLLDKVTNCSELYRARATALRLRNLSGDCYQSLRDCCCALVLDPHDYQTIRCLSLTLIKISAGEDVCRLLDFVETTSREYGDHVELSKAKEIPLAFRTQMTERNLPPDRHNYTPASKHLNYLKNHRTRCQKIECRSNQKLSDYSRRYTAYSRDDPGLCCSRAFFFGGRDEFVVAGSKFGCHVWDKETGNTVETPWMNVEIGHIMPHPNICMLATSGTKANGETVKLWSPRGKSVRDVED